ncbi:anti-sigma factor antagonist [Streptomyces minutiscleroticus]|uniref:Anti-sigma factor antagonist n=1 Tax=Streptomyces minutiscleroticus TaxID=68238 RepID=A0A918P485_9ACTN|nr:STAS domain-containing protein [Streptomyces minutiscleroticus]GGY20643.1 anti-sigma factor antagonist [Streptomyces minutiscleroticus]
MDDLYGADQPSELSVIRTVTDGITVLHVRGEIDLSTVARLRQALAVATAGPAPRLVVDLGGVGFMDSTGLNALLGAYRAVTGTWGWLRLAGMRPFIGKVIQVSGLGRHIECYPTLEQALSV